MPDLSVILPFHNEAAGTRNLFQRLYPVLGSLSASYEIICIDDGSSDMTFDALRRFLIQVQPALSRALG